MELEERGDALGAGVVEAPARLGQVLEPLEVGRVGLRVLGERLGVRGRR